MAICDVFDVRNGTGEARTVGYAGAAYYEPLAEGALECWKARLSSSFFTKSPPLSFLVDSKCASTSSSAVAAAAANCSRAFQSTQRRFCAICSDREALSPINAAAAADDEAQQQLGGGASIVIAPRDRCEATEDVIVLKSIGFRLRTAGVVPLVQNSSETEVCVRNN